MQRAVVEFCDYSGIPIYHIPNGGVRSKSEAARLKSQGVKPGVPDLCIPVARGKYHSLYIELKDDGGKPTKQQIEWIYRLREEGMCAWVCVGVDNALELIRRYLECDTLLDSTLPEHAQTAQSRRKPRKQTPAPRSEPRKETLGKDSHDAERSEHRHERPHRSA